MTTSITQCDLRMGSTSTVHSLEQLEPRTPKWPLCLTSCAFPLPALDDRKKNDVWYISRDKRCVLMWRSDRQQMVIFSFAVHSELAQMHAFITSFMHTFITSLRGVRIKTRKQYYMSRIQHMLVAKCHPTSSIMWYQLACVVSFE